MDIQECQNKVVLSPYVESCDESYGSIECLRICEK